MLFTFFCPLIGANATTTYLIDRGPGVSSVRHLLYPCPEPGLAGLGTHLTLNLEGGVRFGPDVEWLSPPEGIQEGEELMDWWDQHLNVDEDRSKGFVQSIRKFLPGVDPEGFSPDYAGIRPKLSSPSSASTSASDFQIHHLAAATTRADSTTRGFINLMGIESPGLTSSLAIGEMVESLVRKEVWGLPERRGKKGAGGGRGKSEPGGSELEGWA